MPQIQFVEHLDLLTSIGTNNARRGFLPFGRYYGFDTKAVGTLGSYTGFPVNIEHSELFHYTDAANDDKTMAALISRQGAVLFTDEVAKLEVFFQAAIKYQVVYGKYTWVAALGGSTLSIGTLPQVDIEPTDPFDLTGLANDEFPIGYFILAAGGTGLTDITWVPWAKPNLAGKPDLDLSGYAKLAETNKFLATNQWGFDNLTDVNLVSVIDSYAPDPRRLELPQDGGNVFLLNSVISTPWTLTRILRQGGNVDGDWLVLQIIAIADGVNIQSDIGGSDGIIYASVGNTGKVGIRQLSTFYFHYTSGAWSLVGAPTYLADKISANLSSIASLTTVQQDHEQRISTLENQVELAIEWHDMVPATGTGYTTYFLQYTIDTLNGVYKVRGKLLVPAGGRPDGVQISQATTVPGAGNDGGAIPAAVIDSANHAIGHIEVSETGGLTLHTAGVDESTTSATDITIQFNGEVPLT